MSTLPFPDSMKQFGFDNVGCIFANEQDRLKFRLDISGSEQGFVYLWVASFEDEHTIVYVGKAGKALRSRCAQHEGGFVQLTRRGSGLD